MLKTNRAMPNRTLKGAATTKQVRLRGLQPFVTVFLLCALLFQTVAVIGQATSYEPQNVQIKTVTAEGTAAVAQSGGTVVAARRAATAIALRNAVEKVVGVYVSARTLTQNYVLVRDIVTTRAAGFATLRETLGERVTPTTVTVVIRADVSVKPLAESLRALKLTRAWRVAVVVSPPDATDAAPLEEALTGAGFVVVENSRQADVVLRATVKSKSLQKTALETAAGPMTMHSMRADVAVRATRGGDEVFSVAREAQTAMHINAGEATNEAAGDALKRLAPRVAESLLTLPAQSSQPVALTVRGVGTMARAQQIEEALASLSGVQNVIRRGWAKNTKTATFELDVLTDALSLVPRALETSDDLRTLRLRVVNETRGRIVAMLTGSGDSQPVAVVRKKTRRR